MMDLADLVFNYESSLAAKTILMADYASGLSYLHDTKHIMHRDISLKNLAVVTLTPPKGVIIDLDAATTDLTSTDHKRGAFPFLAPEIMELKRSESQAQSQNPPPSPYGRSVDIWAFGICMFSLYSEHIVQWGALAEPKSKISNVTAPTLRRLHGIIE